MDGPRHRRCLLLFAITLLAAVLRLHRIDSLPPGDRHDPAFYGVDAVHILNGARPIYFETNFGREALYSYLVAVSFLILGAGTLAIHVTSAIVGILTVPAVYLVAEEMFYTEEGILGRIGGLLAALTVAISYWHLNWSRYGVRAILVPLFVAMTLYFLWRGLHTGNRWMFVGCGVCMGLSLYTYQIARLLPLLVLFGFVCTMWHRKSFDQSNLENLVLVTVVAAIVFAPLGYYALTHPGRLNERVEQTFVLYDYQRQDEGLRPLFDQLAKTLLAFSIRSDSYPYSSIPGRPVLNPFLSIAFYWGIGISLTRIRRAPYLFLLAWLGLMSVPAAVAHLAPIAKRAIGALPAVAMLIVVGLLVPYDALRRWSTQHLQPWLRSLSLALLILIAAGFVYTGAITYRDYFVVWPQAVDLFEYFEVGLVAIGKYIRELPPEEQVYITTTPPDPRHPSIVLHSNLRENIRGFNGRYCMVLPANPAQGATYLILPHGENNSLAFLEKYFPQGDIVHEGPLHRQQPYFLAYRIPAGTEIPVEPSDILWANWDDKIELLGYDLDASEYRAGDSIHLTLYYRALGRIGTNYTIFVHVLGPHNPATDGPLWGQVDVEPCGYSHPTSEWGAGEMVIDTFDIPISAEAPSGKYDLTTGFYQRPSLDRLPVLDVVGQAAAHNVVTLGQVSVVGNE